MSHPPGQLPPGFHRPLRLQSAHLTTLPIALVRPFRFGMVELRSLTHLMLTCSFESESSAPRGSAAAAPTSTPISTPINTPTHSLITTFTGENLIPKWFEKNPATTAAQDIDSLTSTVHTVRDLALALPATPTAHDFYHRLRDAAASALPAVSLLATQLAVSLFERAAIEAACCAAGQSFASMLADPTCPLGIAPFDPAPSAPIPVRHTVGLSDELADVAPICHASGIDSLKIKLSGHAEQDEARLAHLADHLNRYIDLAPIRHITLDGNESFQTHHSWRAFLVQLRRSVSLEYFRSRLAWVEQPLHRDIALSPETAPLLETFAEFPHIIDESDATPDDLDRALALGYVGTTHKNCKGVFKSIRAARVLAARRASGKFGLLSGEDLTIVAPWSMTQDLAVASAVGVVDIERNGHHYAAGLSSFPPAVADAAIKAHPDLYAPHPADLARLTFSAGRISTASSAAAPFGWAGPPPNSLLNPSGFQP